jgi:SAM-dependent methyltransferase
VWSAYTQQRDHYPDVALQDKQSMIRQWLASIRPAWTLDLGCNTGEFSEIALASGSAVVCLDSDHASVQTLYQRTRPSSRLYPVIAELDDLSAGRGWGGQEHPGIVKGLQDRFDLILMLALIHHLAIGAAVPLGHVANWIASLRSRWLILEIIDSEDTQLRRLCVDRRRIPEEFSVDRQRTAFASAGFVTRESISLRQSGRTLLLLENMQHARQ